MVAETSIEANTVDAEGVTREQPLSKPQIYVLGLIIALNMLEGFDVLAMAFTASGVSAEWRLSGTQLGVLLSAGLFGMAGGSILLSPIADRYGRRSLLIGCVVMVGIFMGASSFVRYYAELVWLRALTGLAIGAMLASGAVLSTEFAPVRLRAAVVCLNAAGYQLGAALGGIGTAALISRLGWRSAFLIGAVLSVILLPLAILFLRESTDFLNYRQEVSLRKPASQSVTGLLNRSTALLWLAFFATMAGYYFVLSWTPKLLASLGMTAGQGIAGGVLLSVGGIVGTLSFAYATVRVRAVHLTAGFLGVAAPSAAFFAATLTHSPVNQIAAVLLGVFAGGSVAGLYAVAASLYGVRNRALGVGWALGVGRIGAILSPMATGILFDRGFSPLQLYHLTMAVFAISALALVFLQRSAGAPVDAGS